MTSTKEAPSQHPTFGSILRLVCPFPPHLGPKIPSSFSFGPNFGKSDWILRITGLLAGLFTLGTNPAPPRVPNFPAVLPRFPASTSLKHLNSLHVLF